MLLDCVFRACFLEDALLNVPNECPHCGSGIDKQRNPCVGRRNGIVESFGWDS